MLTGFVYRTFRHTALVGAFAMALLCQNGYAQDQQTALQQQLSKLRQAIQASQSSSPGEVKPAPAVQTIGTQAVPTQQAPAQDVPAKADGAADASKLAPPAQSAPAGVNIESGAVAAAQQAAVQAQKAPVIEGVSLRDQAFVDMTNRVIPFSPTQIKTLHRLFQQVQHAAESYPGIPPRPTSSAIQVRLSPGATPPIVRLRSGFVSSLVFIDSTGAPWPIKAFDIGNGRSFDIQWDKKSNILLVQSLSSYQSGNLAVLLKGLNTPVMVTLLPGQRAVDYRVDLRVPGFGPKAKPDFSGLPSGANPLLLNVLNGIAPSGATKLGVTGCPDCELWAFANHYFLRTPHTLLSPAYMSTMSSPDGTHAYELEKTPIILMSKHGKMVTSRVKGL